MTNLFLDANILLDFYRFGADDLMEVRKLKTLIDDSEVVLHTNSLLKDEVLRSRDAEVVTSLESLKSSTFGFKPPNYCSGMEELDGLLSTLKLVNQQHKDLITALQSKIESNSLEADLLIKDLFDSASNVEIDADLIAKAQLRQMMNNPPRKRKDSIGDSLHWEALLDLDQVYDFHIVSRDGDFASELTPSKLKDFLCAEWAKKHGANRKIELHKSLGDFFRRKFPHIRLSEETEKNALISQLLYSPNFATTHDVIERLCKFEYFTNGQVARAFQALVENSQVNWIATDNDVKDFYIGLKDRSSSVPFEYHTQIAEHLGVDENDFFLPF
ncbi:PIN domain-containing protein [Yoonia sp.]|uniref:PIN domain-containing protein n=1 Tax=Yoonia sp. TaxID=2212373 RepID=UPI00358F4F29